MTTNQNFEFTNKVLFHERRLLQDLLDRLPNEVDLEDPVWHKVHDRKKRELEDKTTESIGHNLGLARTYARRFTGVPPDVARNFDAACVIGLMKALDTYDPANGSFAQQAFKPIQREVLRAVHAADL